MDGVSTGTAGGDLGVRWWIGKETERECSMRMKGKAVVRKHALSTKDLTMVADHYSKSSDYDHLLFVAMLYWLLWACAS